MTHPTSDSDLMNYLVRMVVPLRREFGRALDVQHFLHDAVYAQGVIELAMGSKDHRLRDYATHVGSTRFGPPGTDARFGQPRAADPTATVSDRYRSGLR